MISVSEHIDNLIKLDSFEKGKSFEFFVKWFLKNDPIWKNYVDKIWLWKDYPNNWGPDKGIDLVFLDRSGKTWAVQAKCYSEDYSIKKADIDSFLSESNREKIDKRLLICTTDKIGNNAIEVCKNQDNKPVTFITRTYFDESCLELSDDWNKQTQTNKNNQPKKRDYQKEAIGKLVKHFEKNERGKLLMACGTGKSFIHCWLIEELDYKKNILFVPSLSLVEQFIKDLLLVLNNKYEFMCVCSDRTVINDDTYDSLSHDRIELQLPVTSSINDITQFLEKDVSGVIVSTYQSSELISKALNASSHSSLDLMICDEAHRCSGKSDSTFSRVLDNDFIPCKKRLFSTATEKVFSSRVMSKAQNRDIRLFNMTDEEVFGSKIYELSFRDAINQGLLSDYQVAVVCVNDNDIEASISKRDLVRIQKYGISDMKYIATQVAILKAIKKYSLSKIITFHSRVERARSFSTSLNVINDIGSFQIQLTSNYVSGSMTASKRIRKLKILKNSDSKNVSIVSNARCLSEGINLPALDSIAFVDPKRSLIDIVQSVGRAIRLSPDKNQSTIIIPVFVDKSDKSVEILDKSKYSIVWDIMKALRAHDNILAEELDQFAISSGSSDKKTKIKFKKIIFDLPKEIPLNFIDQISLKIISKTTESWFYKYGQLKKYFKQYNTSRMPQETIFNNINIGTWCNTQRSLYMKNLLEASKIKLLEKVNFTFVLSEEDSMEYVTSFVKEYNEFIENKKRKLKYNDKLYRVYDRIRLRYNRKDFSENVLKYLDNSGCDFSIKVHAADTKRDFDSWCELLKEYTDKNGIQNSYYGLKFKGANLGTWVLRQKIFIGKKKLTSEKKEQLFSILGEDVFLLSKVELAFKTQVELLERFIIYQNSNRQEFSDEFKGGRYNEKARHAANLLSRIRVKYHEGKLTENQIKKLKSINFRFGEKIEKKNSNKAENLNRLISFMKKNKITFVPADAMDSDFKIGNYAHGLRELYRNAVMTTDTYLSLKKANFIFNSEYMKIEDNIKNKDFKTIFQSYKISCLSDYHISLIKKKTQLPPIKYSDIDYIKAINKNQISLKKINASFTFQGMKIGQWARRMSIFYNDNLLDQKRIELLKANGIIASDKRWLKISKMIKDYNKAHGHIIATLMDHDLLIEYKYIRKLNTLNKLSIDKKIFLKEVNFPWNDDVHANYTLNMIHDYVSKNKNVVYNSNTIIKKNNFKLGRFILGQKSAVKNRLSNENKKLLERIYALIDSYKNS